MTNNYSFNASKRTNCYCIKVILNCNKCRLVSTMPHNIREKIARID